MAIGESVSGSIEYEYDRDVFAFDAREGATYGVDVALGTLYDSQLWLYDSKGEVLAHSDDHGGSLASRVSWRAERAGEVFVEVGGYRHHWGTYALTVSATFEDDHGDTAETASPWPSASPCRG